MDARLQAEYRQGYRVTIVGAIVNAVLIACKLWGGLVSGSQALIADSIHSLSDLASDFVVVLGLRYGRKGEDENHPFGHGRIETLASMFVGVVLVGAGAGMAIAAARELASGPARSPGAAAVIVAAVSIVAKELLFHYTRMVGRRIESSALMSNAWHHRSDALSSVAVLAGVVGARINGEWAALDSVAAVLVAVLIIKVGGEFIFSAIKEFIDTAPDAVTVRTIASCAEGVPGVLQIHDLRARTSGGKVFVEIHITVDGDITVREGHSVAKEVERCLIDLVPSCSKAIVHVDPKDRGTAP
jgi:cation diffusion facilitator family transporter